jgi:hypothetical protein
MNSDVTVFFLEILPRLQAGVLVQVHDIYLPNDYPAEWTDRFYSEQYLLACLLLARDPGVEIILPNAFLSNDAGSRHILDTLWYAVNIDGPEQDGSSFWMCKL